MSKERRSTKSDYKANGSSKVFPTGFIFIAPEHVQVYVNDVLNVINVDYTVTGGKGADGSVVFKKAPKSESVVRINRFIPLDEVSNFDDFAGASPAVIKKQFDIMAMQLQQLNEATDVNALSDNVTLIRDSQKEVEDAKQKAKASVDEAKALVDSVKSKLIGPFSLVSGSTGSIAHGLGKEPSEVYVFLRCLSNNLGYVTGDHVTLGVSGGNRFVIWCDAVRVNALIAVSQFPTSILSRAVGNVYGALDYIDPTKWQLFVSVRE
jgi:hypothetical protein